MFKAKACLHAFIERTASNLDKTSSAESKLDAYLRVTGENVLMMAMKMRVRARLLVRLSNRILSCRMETT